MTNDKRQQSSAVSIKTLLALQLFHQSLITFLQNIGCMCSVLSETKKKHNYPVFAIGTGNCWVIVTVKGFFFTVCTHFLNAIPTLGQSVIGWEWGGRSWDTACVSLCVFTKIYFHSWYSKVFIMDIIHTVCMQNTHMHAETCTCGTASNVSWFHVKIPN